MSTPVVIGCGASKRSSAQPARDLYTGPLFAARLRWAEAHGGQFYVLSAKHGLIPASQVIEPYDLSLSRMSADAHCDWTDRVKHDAWRMLRGKAAVVLASGPYRSPFNVLALDGWHVAFPEPEGLAIGRLLSWHKRNVPAMPRPARKPRPISTRADNAQAIERAAADADFIEAERHEYEPGTEITLTSACLMELERRAEERGASR